MTALGPKMQTLRALPKFVSISKSVSQQAELMGLLAIADLSRMRDVLAEHQGQVDVSLQFGKDDEGRRVLGGQVSAQVSVFCQRCLAAMPLALSSSFALAFVSSEEEGERLPATLDPWLIMGDDVNLVEVVEEELLLALPIVSMHDEPCGDPNYLHAEPVVHESPRQQPFKDLAKMLANRD